MTFEPPDAVIALLLLFNLMLTMWLIYRVEGALTKQTTMIRLLTACRPDSPASPPGPRHADVETHKVEVTQVTSVTRSPEAPAVPEATNGGKQ